MSKTFPRIAFLVIGIIFPLCSYLFFGRDTSVFWWTFYCAILFGLIEIIDYVRGK